MQTQLGHHANSMSQQIGSPRPRVTATPGVHSDLQSIWLLLHFQLLNIIPMSLWPKTIQERLLETYFQFSQVTQYKSTSYPFKK